MLVFFTLITNTRRGRGTKWCRDGLTTITCFLFAGVVKFTHK